MKATLGALVCLVAAACSHDKPASSAYDSSGRSESARTEADDEALTPASGRVEPRQSTATEKSPPRSPAPPPAAQSDRPAPDTWAGSGSGTRAAPEPDVSESRGEAAPDNTRVNERDRDDASLTPPDQQENQTDLKITQLIRKAVMADDSLSFTAKNVKIITAGGKVTLRGPVKSDAERSAIENAARKVAGVKQVDNQLEVKK